MKYWIMICNISHQNTLAGLQGHVKMMGKYIINVAEFAVTRVGRVIKGKKELLHIKNHL